MSLGRSSRRRSDIEVLAYGGTITERSNMAPDGRIVLKPDPNAAIALAGFVSRDINANLRVTCAEPMIDSADARAATTVVNIVAEVREKIAEKHPDAIMLIYGTDSAVDLVAALADGLSPEEIKDLTVLVTCGMRPFDESMEFIRAYFNRATRLALRREMKGRIALVSDRTAYPPHGLEKVLRDAKDPFFSLYPPAAQWHGLSRGWTVRKATDFDRPLGKQDVPYRNMEGIGTYELNTSTDYAALPQLAALEEHKGLVFTAPGNGNIRSDAHEIAHLLEAISVGKPIAVAGKAIHDWKNLETRMRESDQTSGARYQGDMELPGLINGMDMPPTRVRMLLGHCIANAIAEGATKDTLRAKVKELFHQYPFRKLKEEDEIPK